MQFGLACAVVCLNEKAAGLAIWNDSLETRFEAASSAEDDNCANLSVHLQSMVAASLRGRYFYRFEMKVVHCPYYTLAMV